MPKYEMIDGKRVKIPTTPPQPEPVAPPAPAVPALPEPTPAKEAK
jgi:hypothetical protein